MSCLVRTEERPELPQEAVGLGEKLHAENVIAADLVTLELELWW